MHPNRPLSEGDQPYSSDSNKDISFFDKYILEQGLVDASVLEANIVSKKF